MPRSSARTPSGEAEELTRRADADRQAAAIELRPLAPMPTGSCPMSGARPTGRPQPPPPSPGSAPRRSSRPRGEVRAPYRAAHPPGPAGRHPGHIDEALDRLTEEDTDLLVASTSPTARWPRPPKPRLVTAPTSRRRPDRAHPRPRCPRRRPAPRRSTDRPVLRRGRRPPHRRPDPRRRPDRRRRRRDRRRHGRRPARRSRPETARARRPTVTTTPSPRWSRTPCRRPAAAQG